MSGGGGVGSVFGGILLVSAVAASICLTGCQCGYVLGQGLQHLTSRGRSIPLDDPGITEVTSPEQRERLRLVPKILQFAREALSLETGSSYTTYLDTKGAPISYVVTASHPLALIPYRWRFPFVGKVAYKGFYRRLDAEAERGSLAAAGYDTQISPVLAFSSLGWLQDPVLPAMLEGGVARLVNTILHESTHRTIFFKRDDALNESLATFIAQEGTRRFLEEERFPPEEVARAEEEERESLARETLLLRLRSDLDAVYRSRLSDDAKLQRKRQLFASASRALELLEGAGGPVRLAASNTVVLSVAQYHGLVPLLADLQAALGGGPRQVIEFLRELPDDGHVLESLRHRLEEGRS